MGYSGPERRRDARIKVSFVVSYRPLDKEEAADLSQTRNFSQGGMLLTTNKQFEIGTLLKMFVRVLHISRKMMSCRDLVHWAVLCRMPGRLMNKVRW